MKEAAGYSSQLYNGQLYLGTSNGLLRVPITNMNSLSSSKAEAFAIANSAGDAWNLSLVNGQLFMGHNDGAFSVRNNSLYPLDQSTGYWNFQSLPGNTNLMTAGSYKGIAFFKNSNGYFIKDSGEAIIESARFVVPAFGKVWFSHPYKGVFAVSKKNDGSTGYAQYGVKQGVASVNNNYLFYIKNQLLLTTDAGVLAYQPKTDSFEPAAFYNLVLPRVPIRYLKEDISGNVWFVFEKKIGVLDLTASKPQLIYLPELNNKFVAGFEHINPIDQHNVLIGGEKGFYHIDYHRYKALQQPLSVTTH